jgi:hypothetical protein
MIQQELGKYVARKSKNKQAQLSRKSVFMAGFFGPSQSARRASGRVEFCP